MWATLCRAGGTSMRAALKKSTPLTSRNSNMLSRLPLSLLIGWMIGSRRCSSSSEKTGLRIATALVRALKRLPRIELISPLCARLRNGCASRHWGRVLVEKR